MKPKSVTLYDVAEYANVSYQTVSRVINQAAHVSEKTRLKVEAAMDALNYIPNRMAQQLASKLTRTLGFATSNLALHAPSQIVAAAKSRASELHFNLVISMTEKPGLEASKTAVSQLLSQRVDGILINIPMEDEQTQEIVRLCGAIPVLFLDTSPSTEMPHIAFDQLLGARLGVEHLVGLGHQRIALLAGPQTSVSARLRFEGWLECLAAHRLVPLAVMHGDWSSLSGYQNVTRLLNEGVIPTALLVANDQMALGALRALNEFGLPVPAAVSVVGYDDTEDSACFTPPLTTIKQDFKALGKISAERLLALIEGEEAFSELLSVSLIERKTTSSLQKDAISPQYLSEELARLARQVALLK
ncbi:LacI family DNA-binding transcriptional regulator [Klebsiella quasivariicola]|uniref:LacI family DNA-binding transcriptional regulator n=1 Tax=Klebsiella quasivariicola TaxID=2026240 RepID=UPI001CCD14B3|nr:LacI family DNA-binding transcriptional regulator [Klebsiella quasivariicola]MBZ9582953.1 LacI family DNA-binding transcriptional regulator [Klebsiella quasivariicola]